MPESTQDAARRLSRFIQRMRASSPTGDAQPIEHDATIRNDLMVSIARTLDAPGRPDEDRPN